MTERPAVRFRANSRQTAGLRELLRDPATELLMQQDRVSRSKLLRLAARVRRILQGDRRHTVAPAQHLSRPAQGRGTNPNSPR